jgi:membrane protease YdiL (CAAX protease family)
MHRQDISQKILAFFLTKIVIGISVIGSSVALIEWTGRALLDKTGLSFESKNGILGISESAAALFTYILLFTYYEKRKIHELSLSAFPKNVVLGFITGSFLQSFFIFIIFLAGGYVITKVNPVSFLIPVLTAALTAGFVAEIMIRGILFRLTEERFGTAVAIIVIILIFAVIHGSNKEATAISVIATASQAGFLISAACVYSRSLWLPIFIHFSWDFTEPGIYGGINPGIRISKTLFESKMSGHPLLTGGLFGPGNSIQSVILCLMTGILFLWLAKRKNNFVKFRGVKTPVY